MSAHYIPKQRNHPDDKMVNALALLDEQLAHVATGDSGQEILQLGSMQSDHRLIAAELKRLPLSPFDYRSRLRVIASASQRIREVCFHLLGEDDPQTKVKSKPILKGRSTR